MDLERALMQLQQEVTQLNDELHQLYLRFGPDARPKGQARLGEREQAVLDVMRGLSPERTAKEIYAALGGTGTLPRLMRVIKALTDKRRLLRSGPRGSYRYSLPGGA
jgi:hypothetical protein